MLARALVPLRPLLWRAILLYVGLRLVLVVLGAFVAMLGGDPLGNPLGVVLIAAALGAADLRRRRETLLWANLGCPPIALPLLVAAVAAVGELAWALR